MEKRSRGLVNRRCVRRFLLEYASRSRSHRFTRVAESVLDQVEAAIREKCRGIIHNQPSAGRTIK
jgi:hypothetical protein